MKSPLISIIIPTYNRPVDIIKRSLGSVLTQTYTNIEILIVDDSSVGFEGRHLIKKYIDSLKDERIHLMIHKENMGANVARNTGITNSHGDFLAFLDDDDEWLPHKLSKQMEVFEKNQEIGLVYCSTELITTKNEKIVESRISKAKYRGSIFNKLCEKNHIGSTSCVMIKKNVIEQLGMFDINLQSAQDYEMYLRISLFYLIDFVEGQALLKYYRHDFGRISNDRSKAVISREYIQNKYKEELNANNKCLSVFLLRKSIFLIENKEVYNSLKTWLIAVKLFPHNIARNSITLVRLVKKAL